MSAKSRSSKGFCLSDDELVQEVEPTPPRQVFGSGVREWFHPRCNRGAARAHARPVPCWRPANPRRSTSRRVVSTFRLRSCQLRCEILARMQRRLDRRKPPNTAHQYRTIHAFLLTVQAQLLSQEAGFPDGGGADLRRRVGAIQLLADRARFFALSVCRQMIGTAKEAFRNGEPGGGCCCFQSFFERLAWRARRRSGRASAPRPWPPRDRSL